MSSADDRLVADYLSRLVACAAILPPDRRDELVEEISAHIAEARRGTSADPTGSGVQAILDRLGDPENIVRAAAEQAGLPAPDSGMPGSAAPLAGAGSQGWMHADDMAVPAAGRRLGALENCAIAFLLVGGFLVGIGWIVGVILLWISPRWRVGDKVLGTLVWPGGLALLVPLLGFAVLAPASSSACYSNQTNCGTGVNWAAIALLLVVVVAGIAGPVFVAFRLARRARDLPGEPSRGHGTLPSIY
jgi:hypothetical protein